MPNLQNRGAEMFKYLWKRYVYGVRDPHLPTRGWWEGAVLLIYNIASCIYRLLIMFWISMFVAGQLFFIGVVMALAGLVMFVVQPLGKWVHYLAVHPEAERTRWRAWGTTALVVTAVLALAAMPRFPEFGRAEAVVEPEEIALVYASVDGRVQAGVLEDQGVLADGSVLVRLENDRLVAEARQLEAQRQEIVARRRLVMAQHDMSQAQALDERLRAIEEAVQNNQDQLAGLEVQAPIDGHWVPSEASRRPGQPVGPGEVLGMVASMDRLLVRVAADQYVGPRIAQRLQPGHQVEMRVRGAPDLFVRGYVEQVIPAGSRALPSEALSLQAGGALAVDPESSGEAVQTAAPHFQVLIRPAAGSDAAALVTGQRVVVLFRMGNATLATRIYRGLRQMLQQRFQI